MANYTFTASSCYALSTHDVSFSATELVIKLTSTQQVVFSQKYGTGLSIMCQKDDFCVGKLTDNGVFKHQIDFAKPKAKLELKEKPGANTFIGGSDEMDDSIVAYNLNVCPIRLSSKGKIVTIECPCESPTGKCGNKCFTIIKK